MTDEPKPLPVSQADREAAASTYRPAATWIDKILAGDEDCSHEVQSYARHRIAHTRQLEADKAKLREALEAFAATDVIEPSGDIVGLERYHFTRARTALQETAR